MKLPAIVQLHIIVFIWGFTGVIGKLISLDAIPLVWGRTLVAALILFFYVSLFTKKKLLVSKKLILQLLGCGVIVGIHWSLFYGSIKISNISIATSTLSTGTLFVAFLEPIFFKRKIKMSEIILSLVIMTCIFFIFNTEISYWKGILLGISCAFLSALFSVVNGIMYKKGSSDIITFYEMVGAFFTLTALMTVCNDWEAIATIKIEDVFWLLILGGLLTSFPLLMTMKLMKHITPFTLMLSVNLEPVYAILIAFLIWKDSEKMSPVFYISTSIMILAICVNGYLKSKNNKISITK
ncbi:DMT family transporter [uncultured Apibacter sp.]|uniref:DMT family transporter n=1 Tax=uncultured Apibacter sp. TaxID=1778616 RepID=UPI0025E66DFD|nr:DMT family transporter [uncultured Apibacter sp.]